MRNREEQILLIFQPLLGLIILTLGTVPVFAGMIAVVVLLARLTAIDVTAQGFRAALPDGLHGLEMTWEHAIGKLFPVLGSMDAEDLG